MARGKLRTPRIAKRTTSSSRVKATGRSKPKAETRAPSKAPRSRGVSKQRVARRKTTTGRRTPQARAVERQDVPPRALIETPGKYVYCVVHSTTPLHFGPIGIGSRRAEVHTVGYKDLAAVVSDTPIEVYDPTRENVLAHEEVTETVMRKHTVIPMSFGTVFKTREDIVELLRSAYDAFVDVLAKMRDKLEFGLKVLWDREEIIHAIEAEDDDVRRLKSEISSQKGSTYFARMQYGRLLDAEIESRSERYLSEIFDALRDVAVASRTNRPIGDKMIMNAAFLVSREREAAFDQRVKEIGARFDQLTFKFTGPWPPYNFVNIRLKLERVRGA